MNGRRFLVSLRKVSNSEKILLLNSIIKADVNFSKENIYGKNTIDTVTVELHTRLDEMANEFPECQLNEESKEMAVSIAGYVANTLSSRSECNQFKEKLIFTNKDNGHDHDKYLGLLSRGGLTVPRLALTNFFPNFQHFTLHVTHNARSDKKQKHQKNRRKRSTKTFEQSRELCLCELRRLDS